MLKMAKLLGIQIRPKEINKPKYWFHVLLIVLFMEIIIFLLATSITHSLGFESPLTPIQTLSSIIFSGLTVFLYVIIALGDILSHTILKID